MTFYNQEVLRLSKEVYPKEYLTEQIVRSKNFIDNNFSSNIMLDEISSKAFISKFHFIRLFKNYYGRTPNRYLSEVRIKEAKNLLQKGMQAKDVCTDVGFESVTSFTGLFKKMTGSTPILFQKKYQTQKSNFKEA